MRNPNSIKQEVNQIQNVEDLTGVFESLSSTQVSKIKDKAQLSKEFFELLWSRYSSIRIQPEDQITNRKFDKTDADSRKVFILISAEAGLSGDIDQRLIETVLDDYDESNTDIIVLGTHGATQLKQRGIKYKHHFQVPETDKYIDVSPVIDVIYDYDSVSVYYEEYVSLGVQEIKEIDLISRMKDMSEEAEENVMTAEGTIFEPSLDEIADQMEITMMKLALSQTILESTLAQAASRFNAMASAKERANTLLQLLRMEFHHAKRSESDRRMRELLLSLKKKKKQRLKAKNL
jgi:F-type H+-transporting ATPase subunit gamma